MPIQSELAKEGLKAAPPVTVAVTSYNGMDLQDWVYVITIIYTMTMLIRSLPKTVVCVQCWIKHKTCDRKCKI